MSVEIETRIIIKMGDKDFNLSVQEAKALHEALATELKVEIGRPPTLEPGAWERISPTTWRKGTITLSQSMIGKVSSGLSDWKTKEDLMKETGLSKTSIGNVLRYLRESGLAMVRKDGKTEKFITKRIWEPKDREPKIEVVEKLPDLSALRRDAEQRRDAMREGGD
jgi:DNA-binding transcriptional ArsR family regulator